MLVLIGAAPEGRKELVRVSDRGAGKRPELARTVRRREAAAASPSRPRSRSATARSASGRPLTRSCPPPATNGAGCTRPPTCSTRCRNPFRAHMKADIHARSPRRRNASGGWSLLSTSSPKNTAKYHKAAECLTRDREALLAFFDFPAEHWVHLRTTNPIESVFATVRHRTVRTKGRFRPRPQS